MVKKIFNTLNTTFTILTVVYTVTKFMYRTFKNYEEKHGNKDSDKEGND